MPKLIYIKDSDGRDARLKQLIARIQSDDTVSYLPFTDADELADRVVSDLATLLAERFDESRSDAQRRRGRRGIPRRARFRLRSRRRSAASRTSRGCGSFWSVATDRVVTLVGPGGIGKSRLAIEVAHATEDLFPDGTYFVLLEGVLEAGTAAADDRVLPRHPRQRRSRARGAHLAARWRAGAC